MSGYHSIRVLLAAAFLLVAAPGASLSGDVVDVTCASLAIGIADRDVFTAGGVTCRSATGERGRIETISAQGPVFSFIMHLQADGKKDLTPNLQQDFIKWTNWFQSTKGWSDPWKHGEFEVRQFVGLPRESRNRPATCFVYTRYSGAGSSPNAYRHQLVGVSCSDIVGERYEWSDEEIDDLLTSIRYNF